MSVWLTIPSAKPAEAANEVLRRWSAMGYSTAVFRDTGAPAVEANLIAWGDYVGYAATVNGLIRLVIERDPFAEFFVAAADDIEPDPNHTADAIAAQLIEQMGGTFGVMQPTGDDWSDSAGRMIERIAGSPFIGREFAERIYGGRGPYWDGYTHCFCDNEIMEVAQTLGVFWQRPDLIHLHRHWQREGRPMPAYLRAANSPEHWDRSLRLYSNRRAAGFPGHEPSPVAVAVCQ